MARSKTMPVEQAPAASNRQFSGASLLYAPLPAGQNASGVGNNKLIFTLFSPSKLSLHNPAPDSPLAALIHPGSIPDTVYTFYWKLHGHYVDVLVGGQKRAQFVICPKEQNKYHVDVLTFKPLFKDARCRFCDESATWWRKFDEFWKGGSVRFNGAPVKENRWDHSKDEFKIICQQNPQLTQLRDEAYKFTANPRWIFEVFDLSKYLGERQLAEDEPQVDFQFWFGPKTVFDGLQALESNGINFYEVENPSQILVTKDCTAGARQAKYAVQNLGPYPHFSPEDKAYFADESQLRDLAGSAFGEQDGIVYVLSYEEQCKVGSLPLTPGGNDYPVSNYGAPPAHENRGPSQPIQPYVPAQPAPQAAPQGVQPYTPPQEAPAPVPHPGAHPPVQPAPASAVTAPVPPTPGAGPRARRGNSAW